METGLAEADGEDPRKIEKLVAKCVPTFLGLQDTQGACTKSFPVM